MNVTLCDEIGIRVFLPTGFQAQQGSVKIIKDLLQDMSEAVLV